MTWQIKITDSLKKNLTFFKYFGLWSPDNITKTQKWLYRLYAAFVVSFCCYPFTLSCTIDVALSLGDLEKFSKGAFLVLMLFAAIGKTLPIQLNQKKIQDLLDRLDDDLFQPKSNLHRKIISKQMDLIKLLFRILMFMYVGSTVLWFLIPLFHSKMTMSLPLNGYFPYSMEGSTAFLLTYLYQMSVCLYMSSLGCFLDIFIAGLLINVTAQLDVLLDNLENGGENAEEHENCEELEERNMLFLKNCSIHHEQIIR